MFSSKNKKRILKTVSMVFLGLSFVLSVWNLSVPKLDIQNTGKLKQGDDKNVAMKTSASGIDVQEEQSNRPFPKIGEYQELWGVKLQSRSWAAKRSSQAVVDTKLKLSPVKRRANPITLHGLFYQSGQDSHALLSSTQNPQRLLVKIGQTVGDNGPVVTTIGEDHVIVKHPDGIQERVEFTKPKP